MAIDEYRRLIMEYKLSSLEKPTGEIISKIAEKFKNAKIKNNIGG